MSHHKPKPNLKADFKIVLGVILGLLVIYIIINPGAAKFPVFKPSVKIISPIDGAILASNEVKVEFEVDNWDIGPSKHMHFYVDGKLAVMHRSRDATTLTISDGEHKIKASLVDALHAEIGVSHEITITIKKSSGY